MNRSQWRAAGISVVSMVAFIWALNWFVARLNPETYPGVLAYKPVQDMPPRIDLAGVQRQWPNSLEEPGDRNRLIAYRRAVEGQAPPPAAVGSAASAPPAPVDLGTLLADASADKGKQKVQVCMTCHDLQQGGPDRIGPNLWGVVGRDIAARPAFAYSPAMQAQPGAWTYERLFEYLAAPARAIPGNRMAFAGLRAPDDRAAVIRYLATLNGHPVPLPPPLAGGPSGQAR